MMRFRVCTFNIHKGLSPFNLKPILSSLKQFVSRSNSDIVCLQEVIGNHKKFRKKFGEAFIENQFEYISDQAWTEHSYGQNALYPHGDHGNALLSHYEIIETKNTDISVGRREQRGLLYAKILLEDRKFLHCFNTHLNLREPDRTKQIKMIAPFISQCPTNDPIVLCGDFNDWRNQLGELIKAELNLKDVRELHPRGKFKTFPASLPIFSLDRIYYRNLEIIDCEVLRPSNKFLASDHLPLIADFNL